MDNSDINNNYYQNPVPQTNPINSNSPAKPLQQINSRPNLSQQFPAQKTVVNAPIKQLPHAAGKPSEIIQQQVQQKQVHQNPDPVWQPQKVQAKIPDYNKPLSNNPSVPTNIKDSDTSIASTQRKPVQQAVEMKPSQPSSTGVKNNMYSEGGGYFNQKQQYPAPSSSSLSGNYNNNNRGYVPYSGSSTYNGYNQPAGGYDSQYYLYEEPSSNNQAAYYDYGSEPGTLMLYFLCCLSVYIIYIERERYIFVIYFPNMHS